MQARYSGPVLLCSSSDELELSKPDVPNTDHFIESLDANNQNIYIMIFCFATYYIIRFFSQLVIHLRVLNFHYRTIISNYDIIQFSRTLVKS